MCVGGILQGLGLSDCLELKILVESCLVCVPPKGLLRDGENTWLRRSLAVIPLLTTQGQSHRRNEVLLTTYLQRDTEK